MKGAIVAAFETEPALLHALELLRTEHMDNLQTYTPKILEGEQTHSSMGLIIFIGGMLGTAGGFAMQTYANVVSWPLNIGGRPKFSWPAFVPIAFEIGILCAIAAGFFGYLIVNHMPTYYQPIDECDAMRGALRDRWIVAVHNDDPDQLARARSILERLRATSIEEVPA